MEETVVIPKDLLEENCVHVPNKVFLEALKDNIIPPNFWCSEEYMEAGKAVTYRNQDGWIFVIMDGFSLFRPVHIFDVDMIPPTFPLWANFDEDFAMRNLEAVFLDYEFIYNPLHFQNLKGGRWKVFRKNVKKWPLVNDKYQYRTLHKEDDAQVISVAESWLKTKTEEIHDDAIMLYYLFHGENRKGLFNNQGELVAINIWDANYLYINFRYCFCKPEPFLSEFARFQFFTDADIIKTKKYINDGGCLGKDSLLFFKKRLNPVRIRKVYSWERPKRINKEVL